MNFFQKLFFKNKRKTEVNEIIYAPIDGIVLDIEEVPDVVFADKIVGDGLAINPTSNLLVAPVAGTVIKLYDTKHACMMTADAGFDVFIHFGLNTLDLKGELLELQSHNEAHVNVGDPLIAVELEQILQRELIPITPVVVSDLNDKEIVDKVPSGTKVTAGKTPLYRIVSKTD